MKHATMAGWWVGLLAGLIGCAGGSGEGDSGGADSVEVSDGAADGAVDGGDGGDATDIADPDGVTNDLDASDVADGDAGDVGGDTADTSQPDAIDCELLDCDDGNPCTSDECGASLGCSHAALSDAAGAPLPCDDGDACSAGDRCVGGACLPTAATSCDDADPCTGDSCGKAGCGHAPLTAAPGAPAPCDDGDACTSGDSCAAGVCLPGAATKCDDGNPCTGDSCDKAAGCVHAAVAGACDDGDACSVGDACADGVCLPKSVTSCDDGNPCTKDGCDLAGGCTVTSHSGPCDDGDPCTGGDSCAGGTCKGVAGPSACDDGNPCTVDGCVPGKGCTHHAAKAEVGSAIACDDGDPCTLADSCDGTSCDPGKPKDCNDGNACTKDACTLASGCTHTDASGACSDGDACTIGDVCAQGSCAAGKAKSCNDGEPCTADACDPTSAKCSHKAHSGACDDGDACTEKETCVTGDCAGGVPLGGGATPACDDGEPCTIDACDAAKGCLHLPSAAACDDGDACTGKDKCSGGSCGGQVVDCDDGEACTKDSCDKAKGCQAVALADGVTCTSGDACAPVEACASGVCTAKNAAEAKAFFAPAPGVDPAALVAGDVDGDSKRDLVLVESAQSQDGGYFAPPRPWWLKGKGDGNAGQLAKAYAWAEPTTHCLVHYEPYWVAALADLDGDGALDLVVGGRAYRPCADANATPATALVLYYHGDGKGGFAAPTEVAAGAMPGGAKGANVIGIAVADIGGDGDKDIVLVERTEAADDTMALSLLVMPAPTGSWPKLSWTSVGAVRAAASPIPFAKGKKSVLRELRLQVLDLTGDGMFDVLVSAIDRTETFGDGALLLVQKPLSKTMFEANKLAAFGTVGPGSIAIAGDFNGDGKPDLLGQRLSDDGGKSGFAEPFRLVVGNGGASWYADANAKPTVVATLGGSGVLGHLLAEAADFDGDGRLDIGGLLALGGERTGQALWLQRSPGAWTRVMAYASDKGEALLAQGDLDGDGIPELLARVGEPDGVAIVGARAGPCVDGDRCTADACNKGKGCVHGPAVGWCDDGDPCLVSDACASGKCVAGKLKLDCGDDNACTQDSCTPGKGCVATAVTDGSDCSDGSACSNPDVCKGGQCEAGPSINCDDGIACTQDQCDPSSGCLNQPSQDACDDGDACTVNDACAGGECKPGPPKSCDDGDACTVGDSCAAGECKPGEPKLCDDNDVCTQGDACTAGECKAGTPMDCDDSDPCTVDSCTATSGCTHAKSVPAEHKMTFEKANFGTIDGQTAHSEDGFYLYAPAGGPPYIGVYPSGGSGSSKPSGDFDGGYYLYRRVDGKPFDLLRLTMVVQAGVAPTGGFTVIGTHADKTTTTVTIPQAVSAGTSTTHQTPTLKAVVSVQFGKGGPYENGNGANVYRIDDIVAGDPPVACDDGSACTLSDVCAATGCKGATKDCNDANTCTDDACDAKTGCTHAANTATCDDGKPCTDDACKDKACVSSPKDCGSGKVCSTATGSAGQCVNQCGTVTALATGGSASFVIRSGTLWAWGPNANGRLGLGDTTARLNETQVGTDSDWAMVSSAGEHAAAIKTDGSLWTWGKGAHGRLGHGDLSDRLKPTQVGSGKDWAVVSVGNAHTAAIKKDGTLWAWGASGEGQRCGASGDALVPAQIGADKEWSTASPYVLSANFSNTMAIKTDGSLWGCGANELGSLGVGHTSKVTTLTREPTNGVGFAAVVSHRLVSVALKSDGTMWTAGHSDYGRLARSCSGASCHKFGQESSGAKDWKRVAVGGFHVNALKADGTVWSVGSDEGGVLWRGYIATSYSLIKAPGGGVADIGSWYYSALALKTDGSRWGAGGNGADGTLGLGHTQASVQGDLSSKGKAASTPTVTCVP